MNVKRGQIYRCQKSGVTIEVLSGGDECEVFYCCGDVMTKMTPNTVDASQEKHVPIIENSGNGIKIKVGSVAHPMLENHYIMWIEVVNGDYVNRKYLKPGDKPEAEFYVPNNGHLQVFAYCNLDGLWQG